MKHLIRTLVACLALYAASARGQYAAPGLVENLYALQNNTTPTPSQLARMVLGQYTRLDWGNPRVYLWVSNSTATIDGTNVVATRTGVGRWHGFYVATTDVPGFMPKLSGTTNEFLDGTGVFRSVPGGSGGGTSDHGSLTGLSDDDHPQYHNDARGDARYSRRANNLSDLSDAAAARGNLGLGTSATRAVGTVAGTVAAGDDARLLAPGTITDLTDGGDSALHYHAADRDRASHTGTQPRSSISDFAHASTHAPGGADPIPYNTVHGYGDNASRPAASSANVGYLYLNLSTSKIDRSNGTTWDSFSPLPTVNAGRLLGRSLSGSGVAEEIILGTGFEFSGTTLNVTGGSGGSGGLGFLQRSSSIVTNIHSAGETTHYSWTIPAGTLSTDGDAVEVDVVGAFQATANNPNGYSWRLMWDDASTELLEYGTQVAYFPISTNWSSLDWRIRITRVTSNTVSVAALHFAGDMPEATTGPATNKISATLVRPRSA
jgi:hypothetical protein